MKKIRAISIAAIAALIFSNNSYGGEEITINGEKILALLSDARVIGSDFEQSFGTPNADSPASTTYWQGNNASFGWWRVQEDQYCSQWQQNGPWSCFQVSSYEDGKDTFIIWVDSGGRRFESKLVPR